MPGGAKLKRAASKRPCKYGPRDSAGHCPPKPRAAKKSAAKKTAKKRPCKYGPRDADGLCPKKPKRYDPERDSWLDKPITTTTTTGRKKETTTRKVVTEATNKAANEAARKVADSIYDQLKAKGVVEKLKNAAATLGSAAVAFVRKAQLPAALGAVYVAIGKALQLSESSRDTGAARLAADAQMRITKRALGKQTLTKEQETALYAQYVSWYKKLIAEKRSELRAAKIYT